MNFDELNKQAQANAKVEAEKRYIKQLGNRLSDKYLAELHEKYDAKFKDDLQKYSRNSFIKDSFDKTLEKENKFIPTDAMQEATEWDDSSIHGGHVDLKQVAQEPDDKELFKSEPSFSDTLIYNQISDMALTHFEIPERKVYHTRDVTEIFGEMTYNAMRGRVSTIKNNCPEIVTNQEARNSGGTSFDRCNLGLILAILAYRDYRNGDTLQETMNIFNKKPQKFLLELSKKLDNSDRLTVTD